MVFFLNSTMFIDHILGVHYLKLVRNNLKRNFFDQYLESRLGSDWDILGFGHIRLYTSV